MVGHEARTQELLRQRDKTKRTMQVWVGVTVVWAVALGWVAWGLAGMAAGDNDAIAWLVYFVPLAVFVIATLITVRRKREIDAALVAAAS